MFGILVQVNAAFSSVCSSYGHLYCEMPTAIVLSKALLGHNLVLILMKGVSARRVELVASGCHTELLTNEASF